MSALIKGSHAVVLGPINCVLAPSHIEATAKKVQKDFKKWDHQRNKNIPGLMSIHTCHLHGPATLGVHFRKENKIKRECGGEGGGCRGTVPTKTETAKNKTHLLGLKNVFFYQLMVAVLQILLQEIIFRNVIFFVPWAPFH